MTLVAFANGQKGQCESFVVSNNDDIFAKVTRCTRETIAILYHDFILCGFLYLFRKIENRLCIIVTAIPDRNNSTNILIFYYFKYVISICTERKK